MTDPMMSKEQAGEALARADSYGDMGWQDAAAEAHNDMVVEVALDTDLPLAVASYTRAMALLERAENELKCDCRKYPHHCLLSEIAPVTMAYHGDGEST